MSRPLNAGKPPPLDSNTMKDFLSVGSPYRLRMLDLAEQTHSGKSDRECALIEAGMISGRLLMDFLGLGVDRRTGELVERRNYFPVNGATDEVKIEDLGGTFVDLAKLDPETKFILAEFCYGVSKACAHLTVDSGHSLYDADFLRKGFQVVREVVLDHLPKSFKYQSLSLQKPSLTGS